MEAQSTKITKAVLKNKEWGIELSDIMILLKLPWWIRLVKRLPAMQETRVQSLGWEDLEKEMAPHSSTLAWRIPRTEEPGKLQSMGSLRVILLSNDIWDIVLLVWEKANKPMK